VAWAWASTSPPSKANVMQIVEGKRAIDSDTETAHNDVFLEFYSYNQERSMRPNLLNIKFSIHPACKIA
jgi:hypothetical protein